LSLLRKRVPSAVFCASSPRSKLPVVGLDPGVELLLWRIVFDI